MRLGLVFGRSRFLGFLRVLNIIFLNIMICILVLVCRNVALVLGVVFDVFIFLISFSLFILVRFFFVNDLVCIGILRLK